MPRFWQTTFSQKGAKKMCLYCRHSGFFPNRMGKLNGGWERESLLEALVGMAIGQQQRESVIHCEVTALLSHLSIPYYSSTLVFFNLLADFNLILEEESWPCWGSPCFLKILGRVEDSNLVSAPLTTEPEVWAQLYDCTPRDPHAREMCSMQELRNVTNCSACVITCMLALITPKQVKCLGLATTAESCSRICTAVW